MIVCVCGNETSVPMWHKLSNGKHQALTNRHGGEIKPIFVKVTFSGIRGREMGGI